MFIILRSGQMTLLFGARRLSHLYFDRNEDTEFHASVS